jgi:TfoX/Sxy family transcriptional regulator of competence genes
MPKADQEAKEYFRSLVPDDPRVEVKPMFGNLAAFVNKNMFLALFGDVVAVRLPDQDRSTLLKEPGTSVFEPIPGRPMGEYVTLPGAWRKEPAKTSRWVNRSHQWAAQLPPKKK